MFFLDSSILLVALVTLLNMIVINIQIEEDSHKIDSLQENIQLHYSFQNNWNVFPFFNRITNIDGKLQ